MIFLSILIFILAMSLPFFKNQITPIFFIRITALVFIYAGALSLNALHIQSIGSGIGIYSGFFQVTYFSLFIETFLYIVGALILLSWPLIKNEINFNNIRNLKDIKYKESTKLLVNFSTPSESKEYSLIVLFSSLGGTLLLSSGDLLSMYLSIELQSFGLYILATIYRDSGNATGAGLKYFLLGGLSSCLILLGASIIYSFTGLTNFESIYSLVSVISMNYLPFNNIDQITISPLMENIGQGVSLGLVLIVVGFLFKIAAAPFHNWAPDVYDESPTNITIWLTIMPKISIVIFLLELEMGIASQISHSIFSNINSDLCLSLMEEGSIALDWLNLQKYSVYRVGGVSLSFIIKNIFLISALLSLIIGSIVGLAQIRIKRLLAYSTISHVGFLLLALSINTEESTESLILYLIQYIITSLNTFLILLAFGYIINITISSGKNIYVKDIKKLDHAIYNYGNEGMINVNSDIRFIFDLKGQFISNPILSLSLAICLFSMAGIPPLMGFFGKQSVLYAAIGNGYFFMALLAIIVSVISAFYYLRIIRELHSDSILPLASNMRDTETQNKKNTNSISLVSKTYEFKLNKENSQINKITNNYKNNKLKLKFFESDLFETSKDTSKEIEGYPHSLCESGPINFININKGSVYSNLVNGANEIENIQTSLILTNIHSFIIASLTLSILFFVLKPSILLNSIVLLSLSLFNG